MAACPHVRTRALSPNNPALFVVTMGSGYSVTVTNSPDPDVTRLRELEADGNTPCQ